MAGGYMGKVLWVDLSTGKMETEALEENLCQPEAVGFFRISYRDLHITAGHYRL